MFVIAIRVIGSGAPATAFAPAIPTINATLHLDIGRDDRWGVVPAGKEHGHGKIYNDPMEALDSFNEIADFVDSKAAIVAPVTEYIGNFVSQYRNANCAHQVFFEIQKLTPVSLDERAVDLGMF
jgi:hypothetical protein